MLLPFPTSALLLLFLSSNSHPPTSDFRFLFSFYSWLAIPVLLLLSSDSRFTIAVVLFPASGNSRRPISDFQFPSFFYSRLPIPVLLLPSSYFRLPIPAVLFPTSNSCRPSIPVSFNNAYVNNYFRGTTVKHRGFQAMPCCK